MKTEVVKGAEGGKPPSAPGEGGRCNAAACARAALFHAPPEGSSIMGRMESRARILVIAVLLAALALPLVPGCGAEPAEGSEDEIVMYTIEKIIIPADGENCFLVEWMRKPSGPEEVSPLDLGVRFWKWEGGELSEIGREEFEELCDVRVEGDPNRWAYGRHAVTVMQLDEEEGEAVVEVGSLYGPFSGKGVRYLLRKEDSAWKKVSEQTVWGS